MRDAIGSTWVYSIVITFTLIFAGFLILVISYSRAYKIKNEMITVLEKYEGITQKNNSEGNDWGSIKIINNYLHNSGYTTKGKCPNEGTVLGAEDLTTSTLTKINSTNASKDYYYCIMVNKDTSGKAIFTINVFYDFNLPVLGALQKYTVTGQTHKISNYKCNYKGSSTC